MGNQASSCNPGSSCSSRFHTAFEPCAVAKVLLLDGEVLHFTKSVKAIHVLLQHPNHCLCPAQSLRLMHSNTDPSPPLPCNLLPDDELELGRIYILLPFHTFRLFVSAAAASNNHYNTINRAMISHSLPLHRQGHYTSKLHNSFSSRRSSPWINEERPTSNQEEPTSIRAQRTLNQEEPTSNEAPITTLNHILFCRKSHEEEPISTKAQPLYALPTPNQEKPTSNHALPTPNPLYFSRRNPLWINAEEPTSSIQERAASKRAQLSSNQAGERPSSYRTFISKPSINTARRKAHLSSLPASTASRRSFELQRPHRGAIDIRRCRSWRPRLQAITEMSTW